MAVLDVNARFVAQPPEDNNSKKAMIYTADDSTTYIVSITENIGETLGFDDVTNASPSTPLLPRGFTMRKLTFADASGKISGSYPVGNPGLAAYSEGGTVVVPRKGNIAGVVCSITGTQGEKKRFGGANDTGQQSGDAS